MIISAYVAHPWHDGTLDPRAIRYMQIGVDFREARVEDRMLIMTPLDGSFPLRIPFERVYGIYENKL